MTKARMPLNANYPHLVRLSAPMVEEASATSGMISNSHHSLSNSATKDRKAVIMIKENVSREFGYGIKTDEQLY